MKRSSPTLTSSSNKRRQPQFVMNALEISSLPEHFRRRYLEALKSSEDPSQAQELFFHYFLDYVLNTDEVLDTSCLGYFSRTLHDRQDLELLVSHVQQLLRAGEITRAVVILDALCGVGYQSESFFKAMRDLEKSPFVLSVSQRVHRSHFSQNWNQALSIVCKDETCLTSHYFNGFVNCCSVFLDSNINQLKDRVFYNCKRLELIMLPSGLSLDNISEDAFKTLSKLRIVVGDDDLISTLQSDQFRRRYFGTRHSRVRLIPMSQLHRCLSLKPGVSLVSFLKRATRTQTVIMGLFLFQGRFQLHEWLSLFSDVPVGLLLDLNVLSCDSEQLMPDDQWPVVGDEQTKHDQLGQPCAQQDDVNDANIEVMDVNALDTDQDEGFVVVNIDSKPNQLSHTHQFSFKPLSLSLTHIISPELLLSLLSRSTSLSVRDILNVFWIDVSTLDTCLYADCPVSDTTHEPIVGSEETKDQSLVYRSLGESSYSGFHADCPVSDTPHEPIVGSEETINQAPVYRSLGECNSSGFHADYPVSDTTHEPVLGSEEKTCSSPKPTRSTASANTLTPVKKFTDNINVQVCLNVPVPRNRNSGRRCSFGPASQDPLPSSQLIGECKFPGSGLEEQIPHYRSLGECSSSGLSTKDSKEGVAVAPDCDSRRQVYSPRSLFFEDHGVHFRCDGATSPDTEELMSHMKRVEFI
ncbi:MAG: leucine-rich repeat protein [Pseudomonadota bacterium]|nr:leucine-rich repeat protein [Pseudomonadota bacterium]